MNLDLEIFSVTLANQFAQFGLQCVVQEYPHVQNYWLESSTDFIAPRQLTPAFYGCLDWHSAVHNHWMLTRLTRWFPNAEFAPLAREALAYNLTAETINGEINYLKAKPRFECPYGLAWFLQFTAELTEWEDEQAEDLLNLLKPLEAVIVNNLHHWLLHLSYPNRTGLHNQTAFSLGLIWDWAIITQHWEMKQEIEYKARKFYLKDYNHSLRFEPLGYDFLSPCLAEADLMRRILSSSEFAQWLTQFLPELSQETETLAIKPIKIEDPEDYGQSHFDGLHLSRAWMLEGIIFGLPKTDRRIPALKSIANLHRDCGLNPLSGNCYSGSHWLGSFAVYLGTQRGLGIKNL